MQIITVPCPDSNESLIDFCLSPTLDKKEVLTTIRDVVISRNIMRCLCPTSWLVSDIINAYLILLSETIERVSTQKCHFFNTWFYSKLTLNGYSYNSNISRWSSKLGYSLFDCEKLFFPIHLSSHWTLAIVDFKTQCLIYLDSHHCENRAVLDNLAQYLADEAKSQEFTSFDIDMWTRLFPKDIPKQKDAYNCGMYLIMFAYCYSLGKPYRFNWSDRISSRREVVLQLMQKTVF